MCAIEALAARYCKWRNDVVAHLDGCHGGADFVDAASELVTHDEVSP
jgi:hypothetical protein